MIWIRWCQCSTIVRRSCCEGRRDGLLTAKAMLKEAFGGGADKPVAPNSSTVAAAYGAVEDHVDGHLTATRPVQLGSVLVQQGMSYHDSCVQEAKRRMPELLAMSPLDRETSIKTLGDYLAPCVCRELAGESHQVIPLSRVAKLEAEEAVKNAESSVAAVTVDPKESSLVPSEGPGPVRVDYGRTIISADPEKTHPYKCVVSFAAVQSYLAWLRLRTSPDGVVLARKFIDAAKRFVPNFISPATCEPTCEWIPVYHLIVEYLAAIIMEASDTEAETIAFCDVSRVAFSPRVIAELESCLDSWCRDWDVKTRDALRLPRRSRDFKATEGPTGGPSEMFKGHTHVLLPWGDAAAFVAKLETKPNGDRVREEILKTRWPNITAEEFAAFLNANATEPAHLLAYLDAARDSFTGLIYETIERAIKEQCGG